MTDSVKLMKCYAHNLIVAAVSMAYKTKTTKSLNRAITELRKLAPGHPKNATEHAHQNSSENLSSEIKSSLAQLAY